MRILLHTDPLFDEADVFCGTPIQHWQTAVTVKVKDCYGAGWLAVFEEGQPPAVVIPAAMLAADHLEIRLMSLDLEEAAELARDHLERARSTDAAMRSRPARARKTRGSVYVMRAGEFFKIGMTRSVESRLKSITTASPLPVELVMSAEVADCSLVEKGLHARYACKLERGEWYRLIPSDLDDIREALKHG